MNQKTIWLIIGLMSAAIIGVMSLQWRFIQDALDINAAQFDSHVRAALFQVADRIESVEKLEVFKFANGYSIHQFERDGSPAADPSAALSATSAKNGSLSAMNLSPLGMPIEERIDLEQLDKFMTETFVAHGIKVAYDYGVWSNTANSFVIVNNRFLVPDQNQAAFNFLKESAYKIPLFGYDNSPGFLLVHFPQKARVVWGGLWQTLLLSLSFVAAILGCFGYTIWVIYRQKNLSEMKNDFINNMTHEFKTPIATISLATDNITNPKVLSDPDRIRRFIEIIRQENKRMHGQVEKVLQMAVVERGKFKLNFTDVNLNQIVEQAVAHISLQVEQKDGITKTILDAQNPVVEGDLNHISNVIHNLLDNANKYTPEKPEITVTTRNVSGGVEIVVADNGIGMSKDAKKRIFEKFYRVSTGNRHDVKGFGLGLTYVKAMLTAHKGSIDVRSELGKGSQFILFLPHKVREAHEIMHNDEE